MNKDLIIIGAGMFGREVLAWAIDSIKCGARWNLKGFLDDRQDILSGFDCGLKVIGSPENYLPEPNDIFLSAIGSPIIRKKICQIIIEKGGRFSKLIHPSAIIGTRVYLGDGVVVGPFGSITTDVVVKDHVCVGVMSGIGHDCQVGSWSQISGHCSINGGALIGEGVFIGAHATILPQLQIGDWSFVGAGSVVLRKVRPLSKVFGNPAHVISQLEAS